MTVRVHPNNTVLKVKLTFAAVNILYKPWRSKGVFQFEIIINVLAREEQHDYNIVYEAHFSPEKTLHHSKYHWLAYKTYSIRP